jgi:polyhydroxybutyrate depolymerase
MSTFPAIPLSRALAGLMAACALAFACTPPACAREAAPVHRTLRAGGLDREYLIQGPATGNGPFPVVVMLHGGTQTADQVWRQASLPAIGAREGFIVVAPQGRRRHWNDGRGSTIAGDAASTADDVGFLKALIDEVVAHDHGDANAVFLFGVSNGGFMTMRFACEAGDRLRAAATGLATLPESMSRPGACASTKPLPWLDVHGTLDPIVPFAGQPAGTTRRGAPQPALRSSDETFRFWADRAGCDPAPRRTPLTKPADDAQGRWAERVERAGCAGGATSAQVVLHGSGHVFPGLRIRTRLVERITGPDAPELDGGELVWAHFRSTLAAGR